MQFRRINHKNVSLLLNFQVFVIFCFWRHSNPFSPRKNISCIFPSTTRFPVPCGKNWQLSQAFAALLCCQARSAALGYFECPLSSGTAAKQGLSHHGTSIILKGIGTPHASLCQSVSSTSSLENQPILSGHKFKVRGITQEGQNPNQNNKQEIAPS